MEWLHRWIAYWASFAPHSDGRTPMTDLEFWSSVLSAYAWPIAFVVVFWFFRKEVRAILNAINGVRYGEVQLLIDRKLAEVERIAALPPPLEKAIEVVVSTQAKLDNPKEKRPPLKESPEAGRWPGPELRLPEFDVRASPRWYLPPSRKTRLSDLNQIWDKLSHQIKALARRLSLDPQLKPEVLVSKLVAMNALDSRIEKMVDELSSVREVALRGGDILGYQLDIFELTSDQILKMLYYAQSKLDELPKSPDLKTEK